MEKIQTKINKLLNNNMKYTHIENNIKLQNKRNYNYIIKENQNNTEIPKEKIKRLFSESKIIKTEEEEAEIEDNNIFDDINLDNNKNNIKILNNTVQILKKVKTIMKNSNLLNNFRNRFKMFYYELKSYLYYLSGDINKSMSKIFNIKKK